MGPSVSGDGLRVFSIQSPVAALPNIGKVAAGLVIFEATVLQPQIAFSEGPSPRSEIPPPGLAGIL